MSLCALCGSPSSAGAGRAGQRPSLCQRLQRGPVKPELAAADPDPSGREGPQGRADRVRHYRYEDHADRQEKRI